MIRVVRAELLKLTSTRTALGFAAGGVLLTLLATLVGSLTGHHYTSADKRNTLGVGEGLAYVLMLFGVVGATAEFRHRTSAGTALIVTSRLKVTIGRMIAFLVAGVIVAVLMLIVALAIGLPILSGKGGQSLSGGDLAWVIGGGLLSCGLGAMLGVAIGTLIANQVGAVVGTLVFLLIAEPLIGSIHGVGQWMPGLALSVVGGADSSDRLSFGGSLALVVGYTAVALLAAGWVDARRDIS